MSIGAGFIIQEITLTSFKYYIPFNFASSEAKIRGWKYMQIFSSIKKKTEGFIQKFKIRTIAIL